MVSVIFTILTPTLIWEIKQYLDVFIVKFSTNELPSITQWLLSFTNHDNEAFSIGSAFVLKCIAVSLVRHRVVTKEDIREIIKFEFNLEIALKLVNSGTKNSLIGIDLLSISNYPIDDIKHREMLLKNLQSTRTIEQEQAWANMLKEIPIKDEKGRVWSSFLEEVLAKPWSFNSSILTAAMERYQELNVMNDVGIINIDF